ncbi:MAG: arsenosugar biosynthesis radical SAM protein ArsS [Bdellovibrionales bacterium]|nr:arsenosugar biosynthesis radical SAM protein ArsS [Bdellovibrionales bacterium]
MSNSHLNFLSELHSRSISTRRGMPEILQINNGRKCNQACLHCHVEAGPKRTEMMSDDVVERLLQLLNGSPTIHTVDITGGAPELHDRFRDLVRGSRQLGKHVIDRCNLTILLEPGFEDLAHFLQSHQVHIVASLPCYTSENVEKQRGGGVFEKSIIALQKLNALGYGKENSNLKLDLVYNPGGASLPPAQEKLEREYKRRLQEDFNIFFHRLLTLTNMPIKRFLHQLEQWGKYEQYMTLLRENFSSSAARSVMCRNLISISWTGEIFDCDFNQMLEIPLSHGPITLWDIDSFEDLAQREIAFENHCFGCTAGAGSSCSGALVGINS